MCQVFLRLCETCPQISVCCIHYCKPIQDNGQVSSPMTGFCVFKELHLSHFEGCLGLTFPGALTYQGHCWEHKTVDEMDEEIDLMVNYG